MNIELRIPERYWAIDYYTQKVGHRQLEPTWTDMKYHQLPANWQILGHQDQFERSYGY